MRVQGEGFKFFVDGESKTVEETKSLIHDNMTITIKGLDVFYYSPKKETKRKQKLELEDLRNYLLNDNSTPKEATDILYLITAENEEELCQRFSETKLKNYAKEDSKTEKLLKEAEEHQKQNGGVLQGGEFPFDSASPQVIQVYENMVNNFEKGLENKFKDFSFILPKENILGDEFFNKLKETEGQKHNEGKLPIDTMLTVQFPKAIQAVCKASLFGHEKYKETDKDWLNYKRVKGGSTTYANAGQRHNFNKAEKDEQSGLPHIVHKCWNALAELELWIEENKYE